LGFSNSGPSARRTSHLAVLMLRTFVRRTSRLRVLRV